jgi:hypothetical protein
MELSRFALIETIGEIKINQLVENELILEALTITNLNFFQKLDCVHNIFYICGNEKHKEQHLVYEIK